MTQTAAAPSTRFTGRPDWTVDKTFEDADRGLRVEVLKLAVDPPVFTTRVSGLGKNGPGARIRTLFTVEAAVITVQKNGMALARLFDEAALYIQDEMQAVEDDAIVRRQIREMEADKKGVKDREPSPLSAHLTPEQRAEKKRRHEANQAARRAADAEFRNKARGK